MKYVNCFGCVYRLTNKKFVELMKKVVAGEHPDIGQYGNELGCAINVTDITPEEARNRLAEMG